MLLIKWNIVSRYGHVLSKYTINASTCSTTCKTNLHGGGWKASTTVHGTISMDKRKTKWKKRPTRSDILPYKNEMKNSDSWIIVHNLSIQTQVMGTWSYRNNASIHMAFKFMFSVLRSGKAFNSQSSSTPHHTTLWKTAGLMGHSVWMQTCVHTNKVNHYWYCIYMDALIVLTEASSFSKQNIAWIKTLETEKQQKQN